MKFFVLFICTFKYLHGKITQEMITKVNKDIFKGDDVNFSRINSHYKFIFTENDDLKCSILNPFFGYNDVDNSDLELSIINTFFGYMYANTILSSLRKYYFGIHPDYQNKIKRNYSNDQPSNMLSAALITFFPSPKGIISTLDLSCYNLEKEYFLDNESRFENIKMFSNFFIELLIKDDLLMSNGVDCTKKQFITDPALLDILKIDIEEDRDTLMFTLLTLNAFMLEVLDTEGELKEYVTNIINLLNEKDKEILKESSHYFLEFNDVESDINEKEFFSILNNISHCKFPFHLYKQPVNGIQIPFFNIRRNNYDEKTRFKDSVNTKLLHLCNFLFYNKEKDQFDLEHLQLDEDSNLLKFYNKYKKPFNIDDNIRNEWSKVTQCLDDIDVSVAKYNENLGKSIHMNFSISDELRSSIFNIISVLAKICSSENNDIKKKYFEFFDRDFETDNFSDLLQEFLKLIVNKMST